MTSSGLEMPPDQNASHNRSILCYELTRYHSQHPSLVLTLLVPSSDPRATRAALADVARRRRQVPALTLWIPTRASTIYGCPMERGATLSVRMAIEAGSVRL